MTARPATFAAMTIALGFTMGATHAARAQSAADQLQPLVELSARRLGIAEQIALTKWGSHAETDDALGEAQVVSSAVRDAEAYGLDWTFASKFFTAQIEANRLVQYALLAEWQRAGKAPSIVPVVYSVGFHPGLDSLQMDIVKELAKTTAIRTRHACPRDVATAVGQYLLAHQESEVSLESIALDRAMAASCE